jgi:prepilin-type N-terminal cleavage/methylation domain-containing protein
MTYYKNIKTAGFTLVELSIVIIIIGLLISGISAGTELIHQARLNKTVREFQAYDIASQLFNDKYGYFPGDFPNASAYWASGVNGNGNGSIEGTYYVSGGESFGFWQHLSLAGMIQQRLDDSANNAAFTDANFKPDINVPASALNDSTVYTAISNSYWSNYSSKAPGLSILYSGPVGSYWYGVGVHDAYNIDSKMDDGNPFTGKVISYDEPSISLCTNYNIQALGGTSVPANPQYLLSTGNINHCAVVYGLFGYSYKGLGQ